MISIKTTKLNQADKSNREAVHQRREAARTKGRVTHQSKRATRRKSVEPAHAPRKDSKQQICLNLLCRAEGASIEELQQITDWQAHSVRGFLAGAVKRKLGMALVSEKVEGEPRRYRIPQATA